MDRIAARRIADSAISLAPQRAVSSRTLRRVAAFSFLICLLSLATGAFAQAPATDDTYYIGLTDTVNHGAESYPLRCCGER